MPAKTRCSARVVLPVLLAAAASAQEFQITPGAILAQDSSGVLTGEYEIIQYSPSGAELESFSSGFPVPFYGVMVGVTVIDGDVWTVGTGGIVARLEQPSGQFVDTFFTNIISIESVTRIEDDLLIGTYTGGVHRVTLDNQIVWSFNTGVPMTGLTTDGTLIYCMNHQAATIHVFDQAGRDIAIIPTDNDGYSASGIAWDERLDSLWVSNGFGTDDIRRYDSLGTFVTGFPAGWSYINDLEMMPSACVDLFVPQIAAGSNLSITGHAPPSETVALCVSLATGAPLPFAVGEFCGVTALSPPLGILQFVTTSDAVGNWSVDTAIPPGVSLPVHLQAFAGGTCPMSCTSQPITRLIQ